jgi:signal transduction histidine kinase
MGIVKGDTVRNVRSLLLLVIMIFVWLVLAMVYLDRFVPPFDGLEPFLMPWKIPLPHDADLDQRLAFMQKQLDDSNRLSSTSFAVMILSFSSLTLYVSVLYQQKKRRARENLLLTIKNQEIHRRNEFIRYISATIGHEFKNNLGRIKRRIDLLAQIPQDARERIDENLDKLFADIDIFKRISDEREAGLIEFSSLALDSFLEDIARQYADFADISIQRTIAMPTVYAAPPLIRTVFENIFDNAVKYRAPDQVRARVHVSSSLDADGGRKYVAISVRDEGIGMNEQQTDACFYKGKGSGENWGQGLYFAKYVVGLHAGKIRIGKEYTAPGKGTELIIKLPFLEEAPDV